MNTKDQILLRVKKSVKDTAPNAILILYGSYARGANRDDSGIDLLILIDTNNISWSEEKQITYPLYDIEFETGTRISLIVLSQKDWESRHKITPFYKTVAREGIVL